LKITFLAITHRPIVRFQRNFVWWSRTACQHGLHDKICKFLKSRGRTTAILKIVKSPYLTEKSSEFILTSFVISIVVYVFFISMSLNDWIHLINWYSPVSDCLYCNRRILKNNYDCFCLPSHVVLSAHSYVDLQCQTFLLNVAFHIIVDNCVCS